MTREEYDSAVQDYSGRLYRFAVKFLKNEEDANDIVQDSFEKLWKNLQKVHYPKVKSWLFTTTYNAMCNLVKKRNRTDSLDQADYLEPSVQSAEKQYAAREIIDMVMKTLPEQQRSIVLLRDLEGYNYKEIGEILELSDSQVKVYLFRARKKIKDKIKDLTF